MKLFLLLLSFFIAGSVLAGDPVKGRIIDSKTNEPLPGASVRLIDSKGKVIASTVSGLDGSFTFKNATGAEVEISYAGYKTTRMPVNQANADFAITSAATELNTVTVSAKSDKGSDVSARTAERKADNIMNVVSAKTIEVSPDLSVANVSQRVAGVSLQRSGNGEGQYAIVRGMDKRYNYTLVNGIKIPSPDNKNRYVPLDIFPAEMLDRLEVTKALTPNMEGDAIGGVVNMVMKEAPSKFSLRANAGASFAGVYADHRNFVSFDHPAADSKSPRDRNGESYLATLADFSQKAYNYSTAKPIAFNGGVSVGGRVLNNKLGLLFAASSQNNYRDVRSLFFSTETNRVDNSTSFESIQRRQYSVQQNRNGLHGSADYAINQNNKIKLYLAYLDLVQNEYRFASDTNLVLGRVGPGTGRIGNSYRTTTQIQRIYNATLKGDHNLGKNFVLGWAAAYSKATGNQPDRTSLQTTTGVTKNAAGVIQMQPEYLDNSTFRDWSRNSDEDKSGYLNLTYKSEIAGIKADWTVGGMYREKDRVSKYDSYNLRPATNPQAYAGSRNNTNTFAVFNPQGSSTDPLNYTAGEKVAAAYAMVKAEKGNLQVVAGARFEHTDFNWITSAPVTVVGTFGNIKYYDVLPSVNAKYKLMDKHYLRASYFSSLSRPGFYEVTPHTYVDPSSDYPEQGNPDLKRTTAENFDLRYEFFPKGADQILAGIFYKNIKNPIEYAIVQRGAGNTYYSPANFGTGSNYGFELDVTKYLHNFGLKANYTYTNSRITTSKVRRFQKTDGSGTSLTQEDVQQTRPLQGQSKNIANLSLLYKNNKHGVDIQVAGVYTGDRINTVSPFLNNDVWQKGTFQTDISGEVKLSQHFSAFGKANNIFNTKYELEIHQKNGDVSAIPYQKTGENAFVRKDSYGANYLMGIRFKL
jgi:outer membrane receptor protein involved in Fe transport